MNPVIKHHLVVGKEQAAVVRATEGLIEYRKGNIVAGRELYKKSIEDFQELKRLPLVNLGLFFWAKEEARTTIGAVTDAQIAFALKSFSEDKAEWRALHRRMFDLPALAVTVLNH